MARSGRKSEQKGRSAAALCVGVCLVLMYLASFCASAAQPNETCAEPSPVGNAYREWDGGVAGGQVTYHCFQTYDHTYGNTTRTCDPNAGYEYTGEAPVCTLNCGYIRNETYATLVTVNGTYALSTATYDCDGPYIGSNNTGIYCSAVDGSWNHSSLDCHSTENIIKPGNATLDPRPVNDSTVDPNLASDGNLTTYVTMTPGSTLAFALGSYGQRMEATGVRLALKVNCEDVFTPCRLTRAGTEYSGTAHRTPAGLCQRWDSQYPHEHNFTDDAFFPVDGSVADAENYCRNPNSSMGRPWCFTTDPESRRDTCGIPACVLIKVRTVYVDMDGIERSDICSDLKYTSFSYSILNNVDVVKSWSFDCRKADFTTRNLPFGHQITITMDNSPANVTLDVHEVIVYGRPYTEGCGPVKGYWKLELIGSPPSSSAVRDKVTYRCRAGWHYRGGDLVSVCADNREWTAPDVSACTDEPNHAADDGTSVTISQMGSTSFQINDGDVTTCITLDLKVPFVVSISLAQLVEVSEVVVTTKGDVSYDIPLLVDTRRAGRSWSCGSLTDDGEGGTFLFTCPFRPVSDEVVLSYDPDPSVSVSLSPSASWRLCEVMVFGRNFTSALECLQTSKGQEYKGQWSLTVSGRECQRWDSSEPHVHFYNTSDLFPDPSVYDAHNYCRNPPTPSTRPWCFTTDNETRWEYCPIFYCDDICLLREDGVNYTGAISTTASGRLCQNWYDAVNTPSQFAVLRSHYFSGKYLPNRCRNPHGSQTSAWCYTDRGPPPVSELCHIPACPVVNDTDWLYMEPDDSSATPDWLNDGNTTLRECWKFDTTSFGQPYRFTSLSTLLQTYCTRSLLDVAVFCHFDVGGDTVWHYFWYNCTFPEETTLLPTTEPTATTTEPTTTTTTTTELTTIATEPTSTATEPTSTATEPATTATEPATTTAEVTTDAASSEASSVTVPTCDCLQVCKANLTAQQLEEVVLRIKKELLVDKNFLSATIRKKQSAKDSRPSAITTGSFGLIFIVAVFGFLVSTDVISVLQWVSARISEWKGGQER